MADDDEIDILGDFSFNSCFAQNNQGIPSCSNREDTVHPQWLLDSTANNWYDNQAKNINREKDGYLTRKPIDKSLENDRIEIFTTWNQTERDLLIREMAKYGRNIRKISEAIKTKTEAEIQALIEAEHGVNLDTPIFGLEKHEDQDDVPAVVQEEIVTDDTTVIGAVKISRKPFRKKTYTKSKNSLIKPDILEANLKTDFIVIDPSDIVYEEDLVVGSTESIGSDLDSTDIVSKNILKYQKVKGKKIGNHRRKVSRNYDKGKPRNGSADKLLKSPQGRQRKDSSLSEDSTKSPKMQIVLGSGQALPVSEGEQVIKIEKKKDSEPESDIDIDVDSDKESNTGKSTKESVPKTIPDDAPIAVPLTKFEPMPRRQKKINLDGGGGYTIMHTAAGDLFAVAPEPRRERAPRKQPVQLIPCRLYNAEHPAPYTVSLHVSTLISMDAHAHTSRAEVMGLVGGDFGPQHVVITAYRPAAAAAGGTHCDMDPVSQAEAAESLQACGWRVVGWHHSHPAFPPQPSALDLRSQHSLQRALRPAPGLGLVTSQHWPVGRAASQYRCIRVEEPAEPGAPPAGFQLSVQLVPDLTEASVASFASELAELLTAGGAALREVCPQAKITHLEKCISSISHHLRSAGYDDDSPVVRLLLHGIRDVLR